MEEKTLFKATVCLLRKGGEVLLAKKKRKIGKYRWNGYGGGIEPGETPEQAAVRELNEETKGVTARAEDLEKVAIVDFRNTMEDGTTFVCQVHFYLVLDWEGEPEETEEMGPPTWFNAGRLPLDEMLPADGEFIPKLLNGKKLIVRAWYGPFQKELLKATEIEEVEKL